MPKTIAITPSWYWPARVPRVLGVPPFTVPELLVERRARRDPDGLAVVDDDARLTNRELAEVVRDAAASGATDVGDPSAPPTVAAVVGLLATLAAGTPLVLPTGPAAPDSVRETTTAVLGAAGRAGPALGFAVGEDVVWHSHRSLLAGALSFGAFLELASHRPWCSTYPIGSWEGVYGVTVPLAAGAPLVLSASGEPALVAIAREGAGYAWTDLGGAVGATRDAKREVKMVRGILAGLLVSVPGVFDSDARRRVGRQFECPALTVFGLAETGPILCAHPSWYVDEAAGIPVTNAHVVPVDPRSGAPLATLWELVESAMITVGTPALTVGYQGGAHSERFRDGRFVTGVIASSDANGMVYVLPD